MNVKSGPTSNNASTSGAAPHLNSRCFIWVRYPCTASDYIVMPRIFIAGNKYVAGNKYTTRWGTTHSSKVNLPHLADFRALCGANLVTRWPRSPRNREERSIVLRRVGSPMPTPSTPLRH